ncbi:uncharacterized protein LOC114307123 [Camellia sinensis]|uniref:uncharacterized protein LOC114307123 n=1 Tax=Camellia sinensis TaxID=4442 RepID=UPI001035FC02|nr:uncharacterized protein LOC114307123 [Camellia sinensis]
MVDTDYKKARKFKGGLDLEVFDRVSVLKLPTYVEVLDIVIMAEATIAAMKQANAPITEWRSKRSGSNFQKGCSFFANKKQNTGSSSSSSQSSESMLICLECGRKHKGMCHRASGACFHCDKTGHMIKGCPMRFDNANHPTASSARSTPVMRPNARTNAKNNTGNETLRQGRVFSLVPGDVQNTEPVVSGILSVCAQNAYVLIDFGFMHSFVSHVFSRKLARFLERMNCILSVFTPLGSSMMCTYVYPACDVLIGDMTLCIDLLPLSIDHFDCILGMDWLSKYGATIDCVNKTSTFKPPGMPEFVFTGNGIFPPPYLISYMKVKRFLRKGCQGYLCGVLAMSSDSTSVELIPVVCDFPNVFPNDLPGKLIDREIEFTIDIVPGTQPISKTPYRMSTSELKELKVQLQQLLDKKFIHSRKANTAVDALSQKSIASLLSLLTGQTELLCDLEKNEIEVVLREQGGTLAAISAQPAIIEKF